MIWSDFWRQLFALSTRPRVSVDDRRRMKRLVRELKEEERRRESRNEPPSPEGGIDGG